MNSKSPKPESQWQPCSDGTIESASASIRSRKSVAARRQFLKSASAATVVIAGVGFAGWSLLGQKDELNALQGNPNYPGGIACSEVKKYMAQYVGNSLSDCNLVQSIDQHLAKCTHCCDHRDSMMKTA